MMHSATLPNHRITWSWDYVKVAPKLHFSKFAKLPRVTMKNKSLVAFYSNSDFSIGNEALDRAEPNVKDDDAVIIVDHGSLREESNLMLNQFVTMFKAKSRYKIVELAHMELAEPSISNAFKACVQKGARRIIISPFFLFPGRHWQQDIPALAAEASREYLGISYIITAPLGLHELMVDVVNDRIKYCLSHVAGVVDECSVCAGTGKCRLYGTTEEG